ncbi:hypothetical protein [Rhizobium sp. LCM 4573]|uniref:hypothetical protein n=1 Tax=Rhizobium sp. LCM 4573 TaxID=1848291 RepID=UPI0008D9CBC8|nr:hypothetical protein [Rhizobium sp. LCM 4573]OHV84143.1 hypothetical protein LCM4573_00055 [Rhizobium sp. LCM 4573]
MITRRNLVIGLLASSAITVIPGRSRAIEPLTILQAGAAVVGIITGILGANSDNEIRKTIAEINEKLDAVVRLQAAILNEIQALKLYITEALFNERKQKTIDELNAQKDRFDILIASPVNNETRPFYQRLVGDVEQTAFELSRYDFSAFVSFGTAVAIDIALYRVLNVDRLRVLNLRKKIKDTYERWLDANNNQSVTSMIRHVELEISGRQQALNSRPRRYEVGRRNVAQGRGGCTEVTWLTVNGDFKSGFSTSISVDFTDCWTDDGPDCGRHPERCFIANSSTPLAPSATVEVPQKHVDATGYPVLDDFNRERNLIIDEMLRLNSLFEIRAQLEELRSKFS